jgi:hypothetical protein
VSSLVWLEAMFESKVSAYILVVKELMNDLRVVVLAFGSYSKDMLKKSFSASFMLSDSSSSVAISLWATSNNFSLLFNSATKVLLISLPALLAIIDSARVASCGEITSAESFFSKMTHKHNSPNEKISIFRACGGVYLPLLKHSGAFQGHVTGREILSLSSLACLVE